MSDDAAQLPEAIIDTAIAWMVKLDYNTPTPAVHQAFEHWLHADPLHALAWQRVVSLKQPFTRLPPKLLRATLNAADAKHDRQLQRRRQAMKLLSLGCLTLGAGWLVREQTPWQRMLADFSTRTGEQKTLHLADGTVLVLNTDSAVSTDFAAERRLIVMRRGEILVTTGPDDVTPVKRPFWVHTPFGRIQALGTRFVVRLGDHGARISVQEGAVALHPAESPPGGGDNEVVVSAGESRWLMSGSTAPAQARGFEDDAFADGVIAGQNIRLSDLLAELSRYRNGRIVCDERVADLRVSGVFHIKNTDQALQFLAQTQPLSLTYRTRFWVTVGPAGQTTGG